MLKNIVVICHEPLTNRIKTNFYIDDFIQAGFTVEYWDISQYMFPGMKLVGQIEESYIRKLSDLSEIQRRLYLIDIKRTIFIVEAFTNWKSRKFYRLLSDKKCFIVRIDMYGNTIMNISIWQKLKSIQIERIFKIVKNRLQECLLKYYKVLFNVKDFDMIFSSSILYSDRIPINHPDYERYILNPVAKKDGYIVFLDVYYPLHPDIIYMMKNKNVSVVNYQRSLNTFFDSLEKQCNMPIIIAAHPKSEYVGTEFGNRKIVKGETDSLVEKSNMVILHTSNSVSYCILYNKPFALITNEEYDKNLYLKSVQKKLSVTLNIPVWNIDKNDMSNFYPCQLSEEERNKYIYSYLTSLETSKMLNKDILLGQFAKM
ncbi:hypothetical protein [uncultured Parabacteroides sp.]|uniref:hypothetical protein n=1 Tax=uncultured Parabacteroides sp. TaxID=512312 RepID=UPI00261E63AD|nr:hypothetical protein [uncultured Parabacteroides sp.]